MSSSRSRAILLVISGPSGSGKTTLCNRLAEEFTDIRYSVSCTTRPRRPGEVDGVNYCFLDEATFARRAAAGEFLEEAVVHGFRYGTLKATVGDALRGGFDIMMDIDVQGAELIRQCARASSSEDPLHHALVDVFILPPSLQALDERLRDRGQDQADVIATRLENASGELAQADAYAYCFVNEELDRSYDILRAILVAEHHRVKERTGADVC